MTLESHIQELVGEAVKAALARELPPLLAGVEAPVDPDRGYNVQQAAERLGVTPSAIRERVYAGELESIRVGKYLVIPHRSIQAFVTRELARARIARDQAARPQVDADGIDDDISQALGLSPAPTRRRAGKKQERHNGTLQGS